MRDLYGNEVKKLRRPIKRQTNELQKLHEKNKRVLELASTGMKQKEVAEIAGVSAQTVSRTVNSTLGQERLNELDEKRAAEIVKVDIEVESRLRKCFDVYDEVLESGNYIQKLRAADTIILRLGGYEAPKKFQGAIAHGHIVQPELLEALKEQGRKALKECGEIVK